MSVAERSFGYMQQVTVRTTVDGKPLAVERGGREWIVGAEPIRWYERVSWWETEKRMPVGGGLAMQIEVWQVQARIGRNPKTPLHTLELTRDLTGAGWKLRSESYVPY